MTKLLPTLIFLPETNVPLSCSRANCAASGVSKSTKANPFKNEQIINEKMLKRMN